MADTQGITLSMLTGAPFIFRTVNRIRTPLSFFQNLLGYRIGAVDAIPSKEIVGRDGGYDIFDSTRQYSTVSAPGVGPHKVDKKPIGHQSVHLLRLHESIMCYDEEIYNMRQLGGQIGSLVDRRGQSYLLNQIKFMTMKFRNTMEWMFSRMLRGGFNISVEGDAYNLIEYNAAATDSTPVSFQVPSDNLSRMPLGTGSDILTNWNSAAADVTGQILAINAAYIRIHGRPLKHIVINSNTFRALLDNTDFQNIGGTAYRVWDSLTKKPLEVGQDGMPASDSGFSCIIRALPMQIFHVYDGVLSADGKLEGITTTEMTKLVPDDYAYFLPEPDMDWHGVIHGSEVVRENYLDGGREVYGFHSWFTPEIDPAAQELKFLWNGLPVLFNPRCAGYGYVGA